MFRCSDLTDRPFLDVSADDSVERVMDASKSSLHRTLIHLDCDDLEARLRSQLCDSMA